MADEGEMVKQAVGDDSAAQPGDAWGDPISEERQAYLRELFERQKAWVAQPEGTRGKSVFKDVRLAGADVYWLAEASGRTEYKEVPDLHLEEADLRGAHLEGADLRGAHLEGADLNSAHLERANLLRAHLEGADLGGAQLERAYLLRAQLAGADLRAAQLAGAELGRATFNSQTDLSKVTLTDTPHWYNALVQRIFGQPVYGPVSLADIHWNDVDLTVVDWSGLKRLGDERSDTWWWRDRYASEQATRANTQLAKRLRDAGLSDDADRFAYRAQVCQRGVHLLRLRLGRWMFSWLLFIVAGYGYRPLRTLFWYLATIASFAVAYYWTTRGVITLGAHPSEFQPLAWYEALVLSVSSFHGRGFLPFPNLGDPVTILAAIEAVFGLFIEVSFIATFTNRYLGK